MRGVFVTGTDTGVGKTLVTTGLVRALLDQGCTAAGVKPVVSGSVHQPPVWEDVLLHELAGGPSLSAELRASARFQLPASPHFAAAAEGARVELATLLSSVREAAKLAKLLVVEGVGGFRVPLNEHTDTADLARELGLPVVLVVGLRLGCINHALLTADSIWAQGLPLKAWVANAGVDLGYPWVDQTVQTLESRLGLPCAAVLPSLGAPLALSPEGDAVQAAQEFIGAWQPRLERAALAMEPLARQVVGWGVSPSRD